MTVSAAAPVSARIAIAWRRDGEDRTARACFLNAHQRVADGRVELGGQLRVQIVASIVDGAVGGGHARRVDGVGALRQLAHVLINPNRTAGAGF